MKRLLSVLLVLLMLTSFLSAAGTSETGAKQEKQQVLHVMMSSGDAGPGNIRKALDSAAEIMGITLQYDVIPDDQMLNVTNTRLVTGNAGDIIVHNFGLTDVSAKDLAPLSGPWVEKITSTTKPLTKDGQGNVLKAPLGGESNMGLLYNKEVLEASGVSLPIMDYGQFVTALKQVKDAGYTPVYISNKEVWTAQILLLTSMTSVFANNPDVVEGIVTNTLMPSDVPELVALWENALSLKTMGLINKDYMSATNDMALEALANGEVAFYAMLDNAYGTLKEFYPESVDAIGMMYTPLWDDVEDGYVLFGTATNYLSAVADSSNLDLAKEFINTMLTEKPLKTYYELVPGAVPYTDLGFSLNMSPFNQEMKEYAKMLPSLGDFNNSTYNGETPLEPFYGKFNEQIQGLFAGLSVEEALERWYEAYAADAQARRVPGF
ncbi:ABC transporter substrate-binding protein [Sphaerochaeta sp. S2]|uniref:ABC transporter substrate-binding protein n=1 Tax=Sphaerochaeta sp. S2 TaxID=2798868 RepID=UPI0018E98C03|nr:ABC transporter substrate-binding protein [Sphaerochaeta sp. S2]MBJ2355819.1 carbohydrate ABC transporter substrate-binding protein [Sphaerochaeta sp. S2]